MTHKLMIVAGTLLAGFLPTVHAAEGAAPSKSAAAARPSSPGEQELRALVQKIQVRLRAGARTEEALENELKEFNALLEKHREAKSPAAADIAAMRAMLFFEVFGDVEKGEALLVEAQREFPESAQLKSALEFVQARREAEKAQAALKVGAVFPDFAEKDMTGAPLSISRFKGKVVLVDFWAVWCGPCVAELPNVLAAYEKYHAKGLEIVGISLDQSEEKLKAFLAEKKMTWPQYFDGKGWENKLAQQYGIKSIPATFLLDREGRIVAKNLRGDELEKELEFLFAK